MSWKSLAKYLTQKEHIAGISVTDKDVRLLLFSNKKNIVAKLEADLENGVVENGELKKPEELKKILNSLRNSPELEKIKNIYTTLTLSSGLVYHKIFDLPVVSVAELTEAVDLNMKMVSPIKFEESYSDWEIFKTVQKNQLKYIISAIFGKKTAVDPYLEVLSGSGFLPLAVEFQAMSLQRLFSDKNLLPSGKKSCLIVYISSEGVDFSVMSNEGLKFNYFQSWQEAIQKSIGISSEASLENINREDFFKIFTEQSRKIMSFYSNRINDELTCFYLLSPIYQTALDQIVSEQFGITSSKQPFSFEFSPGFFSCAGAALRGLIPRTDDIAPSLMGVGTEEEYRRRRIFGFVGIWNKVIFTTVGLLVAVFFGVWLFFDFSQSGLDAVLSNLNVKIDQGYFQDLQSKTQEINETINQLTKADEITKDWTGFWQFLQDQIADQKIGIRKMAISTKDNRVLFLGTAPTETNMIDFKNSLGGSGYFSNVEIPLQSIIKTANGIEFNLNFKIEKLPE